MEHVTGQPLSEAETAVFDLIDTVNGKFRHKTVDPNPASHASGVPYSELFFVRYNPAAPSLDTAILKIGLTLLEEMGAVYRIYPEVVKNALPFAIEHEAAHIDGPYSAAHIIRRRQARPNSPECFSEREYKANLQAMTSRLKAQGMTFEKMEEEVAAHLWLIGSKAYKHNSYSARPEKFTEHFSLYIDKWFPKLGEEFKEQVIEKVAEIDKEYRRRCKEMADHEVSPLSFGHKAAMPGEMRNETF